MQNAKWSYACVMQDAKFRVGWGMCSVKGGVALCVRIA